MHANPESLVIGREIISSIARATLHGRIGRIFQGGFSFQKFC